jgi:Ca2+-binding RTX toxin-like protein
MGNRRAHGEHERDDGHEHGDRRGHGKREHDGEMEIVTIDPEHGGDDKIITGAGADIIFGGPGKDRIQAGDGKNIIFGDLGKIEFEHGRFEEIATTDAKTGGNDMIDAGTGNNIIFGGAGNDIIDAGKGRNRIFGDFGRITREHNDGHEGDRREHGDKRRHGKREHDGEMEIVTIDAEHGGNDIITAGTGNDIIFGGPGYDEIHAGDGNNIVFGDHGEVEFKHGKVQEIETKDDKKGGKDTISAGTDDDLIFGGAGDDMIQAGDGKNVVFGDHGEVEFKHGKVQEIETKDDKKGGNDTISTGAGDDIIFGGPGSDTIHAGAGKNRVFNDQGEVELEHDRRHDMATADTWYPPDSKEPPWITSLIEWDTSDTTTTPWVATTVAQHGLIDWEGKLIPPLASEPFSQWRLPQVPTFYMALPQPWGDDEGADGPA